MECVIRTADPEYSFPEVPACHGSQFPKQKTKNACGRG